MENQDKTPKTRMEKTCNAFGLKMHQLFNVSDKNRICDAYTKDNPYFFTEGGICKGNGEFAQSLMESLAEGSLDIKPLKGYRYQYADTVDAENLLGQEIKTEIASLEDGQREKALYAVATIGGQGVSWRVEVSEEGMCMRRRRTEFTDFAQAVKFYNRQKLV